MMVVKICLDMLMVETSQQLVIVGSILKWTVTYN